MNRQGSGDSRCDAKLYNDAPIEGRSNPAYFERIINLVSLAPRANHMVQLQQLTAGGLPARDTLISHLPFF